MLSGIFALKEELSVQSLKLAEKAEAGTFPEGVAKTITEAQVKFTAGVAVLRQMIGQVSEVDVDFCEPRPKKTK